MALADLIARLEQDAAREVQTIAARADAEVESIHAGTEDAVAATTTRELGRRRAERRLTFERELALANRQAQARELDAHHARVARILARARELVPAFVTSDQYLRALPAHAVEALAYLEGLRPRIRCQAALAPALRAVVAAHEGAELVIDSSTAPGFVAESADGSVVIDNTLAARLSRIENALAVELHTGGSDARA